jgi:hypothetical protein
MTPTCQHAFDVGDGTVYSTDFHKWWSLGEHEQQEELGWMSGTTGDGRLPFIVPLSHQVMQGRCGGAMADIQNPLDVMATELEA